MYNKYLNKVKKVVKSSSNKSKKTSKNEQTVHKFSNALKFGLIFLFILGTTTSFLLCKYICRNDCFEINGKKSISIFVNDTYIDEGVKAIGFGKDLKDNVCIEIYKNSTKLEENVDIDTSEEAVYQIVYSVSSFRFKDIKLIRTLTIVSNEIVDPEENAA